MTLYHFTAVHHLNGAWPANPHAGFGILKIGIQPHPHPLIGLPPMVWLTEDGGWGQVWSPRPVPGVNCDRTEVRIEVRIPKTSRDRLLSMDRVTPFVRPDWREDFVGGYDVSAWRAFPGTIPAAWLRGIAHRDLAVA